MGLTRERLQELLDYDPETGVFTRKVVRRKGAKFQVGSVAGFDHVRNGELYRRIGVDNKYYYASRLAVLWMTGVMPEHEVDHVDRNTTNDRVTNLRKATRSQNQHNRAVRYDSSTGFKGVALRRSAHGNKCEYYVAQIGLAGNRIYLGSFKTAEEAHKAYTEAAALHHKEFARS